MTDVCCKKNVLDTAKAAGFGLQMNAVCDNDTQCDRYEREMFGGCIETAKMMTFAKLLIEQARVEWELDQERVLSFRNKSQCL